MDRRYRRRIRLDGRMQLDVMHLSDVCRALI
jgi:hypothetical protein